MNSQKNLASIEKQLHSALKSSFKDVSVKVGMDIHYKGCNIVVTSPDFAGLLPEQRYHHVAHALPSDLYEELRGGYVWFELAPGEPALNLMKMPRSEDIASRDAAIHQRIRAAKFFKKLEGRLRASRKAASQLDFVLSKEVLSEEGWSAAEITDACLFFIRHGGHCDADVLSKVMDDLSRDDDENDAPADKKPGAGASR